MRLLILLAVLMLLPVPQPVVLAQEGSEPLYKNPRQPVDVRVADLLSRMTLAEKAVQLQCLWGEKNALLDEQGQFAKKKAESVIPHGIGHIARPSDNWQRGVAGVDANRSPRRTVELVNAVQRYHLEQTRLGIPVMMHEEGLHGFQARGATHFPQAIALASTWDVDLVEQVYQVVGREIRAWGSRQALTPVVDVARDPRWGRIEETYGEDPHLVSEMGLASVRGFQGRWDPRSGQPLPPGHVIATLKHMTGHGQPQGGTNIGPAQISRRVLREVFFPPFERAVKEGGAWSVMASYNEIDGVPSHVNRWLLTDVLRGEWGFEGYVVADYYAVAQLLERHRVVESLPQAGAQALLAGVDVELPDRQAFPPLPELVQAGELSESQIDVAVARVLRAKLLAGLFEDPYADADLAEELTANAEARQLAERAAEKAAILLRNEGALLPLDLEKLDRIAVIGPNADEAILGGYSDVPAHMVPLLDGIRARVAGEAEVVFAPGVRITKQRNWFGDVVELWDVEDNRRMIAEAVESARRSDVAIVAVGGNEQTSREAWAEQHLGDRTSLQLVGEQGELVRAVVATGTPTVVVLIHGRPLAVTWIAENVPAIVEAWYPGQEGGAALARVLFGDVNPGGKLPVTIPRSVGHLPAFYNYKPTARRGYLFDTIEPLWPFGFGLSYTTFEISAPQLDRSTIGVSERAAVSVQVTNTGARAGDEVVQLYIRDRISSVTRPVLELKGFRRITLEPGESRRVSFEVGPAQLRFYDRSMRRVVEPGEFEIRVGSSSVKHQAVTLRVN
ncbi:MAG TPA: glycoside hydrolase family 3 N-terminal domain-containing protein [Acidobacteriota bacterium]|nr:glycoside hydrolase family 3 N-terminal domain-containing protein [Acidobacteriota bacterium]